MPDELMLAQRPLHRKNDLYIKELTGILPMNDFPFIVAKPPLKRPELVYKIFLQL